MFWLSNESDRNKLKKDQAYRLCFLHSALCDAWGESTAYDRLLGSPSAFQGEGGFRTLTLCSLPPVTWRVEE